MNGHRTFGHKTFGHANCVRNTIVASPGGPT